MLDVDVLYIILTFSVFGQVNAYLIITIEDNIFCF